MKIKYFLLVMAVLSLAQCRKEGCTDCNATNYNAEVRHDDGSCKYKLDRFIGKYEVFRRSYLGGTTIPAGFSAWSTSVNYIYYVSIQRGSDAVRLYVSNIDGFGVSFEGVVYPDDKDTFSFDFEEGDFHYCGEVNVEGKHLNLTYSYSYLDGLTYDCVVEGDRVE